jgi:FG-GAP repeat protein
MGVLGRSLTRDSRASVFCTAVATLAFLVLASPLLAQEGDGEPGKLVHSDPNVENPFGDNFGLSVAVSGNTAVVGTPTKDDFGDLSGAVYVFVRAGADTNQWIQVAKLIPRDVRRGLQFGRSVAISGDTIIVGAVGDDEHGEFTGSAYIFARHRGGPNAWGEVAKLRASDAARGDVFGESVSISGDTAVVGAPQNQAPFPARAGFATIFVRNHLGIDVWGEVARVKASDGQSGDRFGSSISISGGTIIVGSPDDDHPELPFFGIGAGSAYIFARQSNMPVAWAEVVKLIARDAVTGDGFGWAVAIDGDAAIVGAPGGAPGGLGQPSTGVAYVFSRGSATAEWGETAKLIPGGGANEQLFGGSVSISGDTAVVGASSDDEKGSRSGSAHAYSRRQGTLTWEQGAKLTAHDGKAGDQFGWSVSLSGTTAIVGAPTFDDIGSAYVCAVNTVNSATGACRDAIPVVNHLVTMSDVITSCCDADEFRITATFTNTGSVPIRNLFIEVTQLARGNLLENADGGPGGVGATLTPDVGDRILSPGEATTVTFVIRLVTRNAFWIYVNLRGELNP